MVSITPSVSRPGERFGPRGASTVQKPSRTQSPHGGLDWNQGCLRPIPLKLKSGPGSRSLFANGPRLRFEC